MAIRNTNVQDLPRPETPAGVPPTQHPEYVNRIAATWEQENDEDEGYGRARAIPEAGPYRGSFASIRCDRQLHYALAEEECPDCSGFKTRQAIIDNVEMAVRCERCEGAGVVPLAQSNPPTLADKWRFKLGKIVHDEIERLLPVVFPDARAEVDVDLNAIGIPGSAHADMVDDANDAVIEHKSVNGFKYKMQTTTFKKPPEGPSYGAILQAAMVAEALGKSKVVVTSFSLENLSPKMASSFVEGNRELGRFAGEWHYDVAELREDVLAEVKRVGRVLKFRDTDMLPAREFHDPSIPSGAVVVDPNRGMWQVVVNGELRGSSTTWMCDYCPQRDRCIADGPT